MPFMALIDCHVCVCCVQGEDGFPGAKGEMGAKGDIVITRRHTQHKH